jgi:rod shape-determining protein MreB
MRLLPSLTGPRSGDLGVDLGTATTVLCVRGGEQVISEPSVVAVDARTGNPLTAGREALELLGREHIAAIRPIKDGTIVDLHPAAQMLRYFITKVGQRGRSRPRVVASASSAISAVQRRAVAEVCVAAGAREVRLIARPLAAALGCGLPVHEPIGSMVLDIGANMSEVAIISMRSIVASQSIEVGDQEFDQRIVAHLKRTHQLLISEHTVEHVKAQIGAVGPDARNLQIEILGRDLASGTLKSLRLTGRDIRDLLERPITRIIEAVKDTLVRTPPQLAGDVIDRGITVTGGSPLLRGVAHRIGLETGTPARVAESGRTCIAIGAARSLESQPTLAQDSARTAISFATAASH